MRHFALLLTCIISLSAYTQSVGQLSLQVTAASCPGCCDGSVDVSISGCTSPYDFQWIGPDGFLSVDQDLSELCAGTYIFTVIDSNGHQVEATAQIGENAQVGTVTETWLCGGQFQFEGYLTYYDFDNEGEACMTPPYCWVSPVTYTWSDASGMIISTESCIEDLPIGDYSAHMSSDEGEINFEFSLAGLETDSTLYALGCEPVEGCTDPAAANYDPLANVPDGSCEYVFQGLVYHDVDENGVYDGADYGLAGETVTLDPPGLMAITDAGGVYQFPAVASGNYTLSLDSSQTFTYHTTFQSVSSYVGFGNAPQVDFGLSDEEPLYGIDLNFYPPAQGYACDVPRYHYICFRNMGNITTDGLIEFQFDSLFQSYTEVSLIDSADGNTLWFSFEDLVPNEQRCYSVLLQTPTVDHIGEYLTSYASIWGINGSDTVAYGQEQIEVEVTCAYDPNDKQVFPEGYSDMHYIAEDTELEYLIRFQNTGNAPATDVRILDTLDADLDLSSFQLLSHSHDLHTTIDPQTRVIDFYFENIMLPDSVNNEPESHGFVSFAIKAVSELPLLTELTNSASIYFDNNPPILTNTTWSTTYDCSLFTADLTQDGAILTASEGDTYQWYLDGEPLAGATEQLHLAVVTGNYSVAVGSDFPCLETSPSVFVLISSLSEVEDGRLDLFPNPMSDRAILVLPEGQRYSQLEIYDLQGRLLRQAQGIQARAQLIIERDGLAAGQYLLRLSGLEYTSELRFSVE